MNKKLLFSAAALVALAMGFTPALAQPAGCMSNCPGTNLPSTSGQASGQAQSPTGAKTAGQTDRTMKRADEAPRKSGHDSRRK